MHLDVERLVAERQLDARHELVLGIGARGIADHALVFRELVLEAQRVLPVELGLPRLLLGTAGIGHRSLLALLALKAPLTLAAA